VQYEYYFFDDEDMDSFMCSEEVVESAAARLAYASLAAGAGRADVFRLSLLSRYGGVWVDSDCASKTPLRDFVWRNASAVSGLGRERDFHQWVLLYSPGHPFLRAALDRVAANVVSWSLARRFDMVTKISGPPVYFGGIQALLEHHGCSISDPLLAGAEGAPDADGGGASTFASVKCSNASDPLVREMGVVQLFANDYLGGNIVFKAKDVDKEKSDDGDKHYKFMLTAEELYRDPAGACAGRRPA
jgi:hypothetical protein